MSNLMTREVQNMAFIFLKYSTKKHVNMALILGKYGIYLFKTWQNKQFFKESEATVLHFSFEREIKIEFSTF
jgi:hypothetical protein